MTFKPGAGEDNDVTWVKEWDPGGFPRGTSYTWSALHSGAP